MTYHFSSILIGGFDGGRSFLRCTSSEAMSVHNAIVLRSTCRLRYRKAKCRDSIGLFSQRYCKRLAIFMILLLSIQLGHVDAHYNNRFATSSSLPMLPSGAHRINPRNDKIKRDDNVETLHTINNAKNGYNDANKIHIWDIRGGGGNSKGAMTTNSVARSSKKRSKKSAKTSAISSDETPTIDSINNGDRDQNKVHQNRNKTEPNVQVKAILLPRQTSMLTPLRFLSFMLINISLNFCMQTSGQPLEDAVRRLLDMPSPESESNFSNPLDTSSMGRNLASKVTQLHIYVAKKIVSSSASSSVGILPPAHLPSPIHLLGLFLSVILYVGGTILVPKWSVGVNVLFNYMQYNIHGNDGIRMGNVYYEIQSWFDDQKELDEADSYYQSSLKNPLCPAVLVYETDLDERELSFSRGSIKEKLVICPLLRSHEYDVGESSSHLGPEHQLDNNKHLEEENSPFFFELNKKRYYYNPMNHMNEASQSAAVVDGGPTLHKTTPLPTLLSPVYTRGLCTQSQLMHAKQRYGSYNHISIPIPTITSAFVQRITSPLVSLQLLGRLLSLVEEESVGRSIANLVRLGFQHLMDAKRSIANAITLAEEVRANEECANIDKGSIFWAVRPKAVEETTKQENKLGKAKKKNRSEKATKEWVQVSANELLPGDVFLVESATGSPLTFPVDALLLETEAACVTEEAALTGESVPQAKTPLDIDVNENDFLDMTGYHRSSCVFAGTKLLHSANYDESATSNATFQSSSFFNSSLYSSLPQLPKGISSKKHVPPLFLTLRTGSYSSRGESLQSLLKHRMNMGAMLNRGDELDSLRLIAVLAAFAVGACIFLFIDTLGENDSIFKRIVQCTRIAVAAVPSDLPSSLSVSARECAAMLRDESDAICSESGSLLESSKIDMVVFDKTGTLTADTQKLVFTVHPPVDLSKEEKKSSRSGEDLVDLPLDLVSNIVLAGGHTLMTLDNDDGISSNLVGDPLDIVSLSYTRWKYDARQKSAISVEEPTSTRDPVKLWQIRSFPFDANKKMSSAIVLIEHHDGKFSLWCVVKGAPGVMRSLLFENSDEKDELVHWYDENTNSLGRSGYRSVSLGALDVTDTAAARLLFPEGLPDHDHNSSALQNCIHEARGYARGSIHRSDIEQNSSNVLNKKKMACVGFACFEAPMRTGSPRIVKELKDANMEISMLTGDEAYASLAIATKAGIISGDPGSNIYLLKVDASLLVWEVNEKLRKFSLSSAKEIHHDINDGNGIIVFSGDAISSLLSENKIDEASEYVRQHLLPKTSLVAGASPHDKYLFIRYLQRECNKRVLMCGDGVNDIAAMKESDVSVAMLSGFGHEFDSVENSSKDNEDLRRKERLKKRCIGNNRLAVSSDPSLIESAGVGNSPVASVARMKLRISKGLHRLQNDQTTKCNHNDNLVRPPLQETIVDVIASSFREEINRYKALKKGGSGAARILSEEERLRRSILGKVEVNQMSEVVDDSTSEHTVITTGEASLASSFTLLRPCISGVESILRTGIAAAGCSISIYRKVALNCMLSCYNLATLYREGLRYGKYMWQVELAGITFMESASFMASSTPRPRLVADIRPSTSPFNPAEAFSTFFQAVIHIITLTLAVNSARHLESKYPTNKGHGGFNIKLDAGSNGKDASAGALLASLVGSSSSNLLTSSDTDAPKQSFFRRTPFQPNYVSNNVFIVSVFQNAVMTLVNHSGRPFSVSFLESRSLCLSIGLSILLCTACISETFPMLNRFLELAPFPTKSSKIELLRILLLNSSSCYFAEYVSTLIFQHDVWRERNCPSSAEGTSTKLSQSVYAADEENKLLAEERKQNLMILCFIGAFFVNFCFRILAQ